MSGPRTNPCSSCGAEIFFAYTEAGAKMPLDAAPIAEPVAGAYRLEGHNAIAAAPLLEDHSGPWYMTHFATCPTAGLHKTKRSKQ